MGPATCTHAASRASSKAPASFAASTSRSTVVVTCTTCPTCTSPAPVSVRAMSRPLEPLRVLPAVGGVLRGLAYDFEGEDRRQHRAVGEPAEPVATTVSRLDLEP